MTAPAPGAPDAHRLQSVIGSHVRIRFSLSADTFAGRLLEIARRHGASGDEAIAFSSRLNLDDLYLTTACAAGDEAAWVECIGSHREFIHRFARRVLKEPQAGDLADEVIADLWQRRKIARYEGRSALRTWLGTVVSHAAINAMKASKARAVREDRPAALPAPRLESGLEDAQRSTELAQLLAESIARQPSHDQLLVLLHYEQGLTLEQIEPVMGLSKAALSRRLKRIRDALLAAADELARRRVGTSARALADGLDLSLVDLDLRAACHLAAEQGRADSV